MNSGTLIFPHSEMEMMSLFVGEETCLETLKKVALLNNSPDEARTKCFCKVF